MKQFLFFAWALMLNTATLAQVTQFPQVFYNGQGSGGSNLFIRQSPSLSSTPITTLSTSSRIGAESFVTSNESNGKATWAKVMLPSSSGTVAYGYMLYGEFYARIYQSNNYATVNTSNLNIRTGAGTSFANVTLNGSNATVSNGTIVALTGSITNVSGVPWYQIHLPNNCSQITGWVSGSFLNISANQSYYIVAGTVTNSSAVSIWGATINMSGSTTNSTEGFYQYKLSQSWSGTISCSHSSYNTSSPTSYNYTATSNNYSKNFVLSNGVTCSTPTAPSNFKATGSTSSTISLSWDPSVNAAYYEIYDCATNSLAGNFSAPSTSGNITGLTQGTSYQFKIRAMGGSSCPSSFTSCITANTQQSTGSSYTISGNVAVNGAAVQGAIITANPGGYTATTNNIGNYAISLPSGWSGTLTPSLSGFTFSPADITINNLTQNLSRQDFAATPLTTTTYSISGRIKNVDIDMPSRKIIYSDFAGCTINAYYVGTNTLAASTISSANGSFKINLSSSGNYDIKATDNTTKPCSIKLFSIATNSNIGDIRIPSSLLGQIEAEKNKLLNLYPTISSLGNGTFAYNHNVAQQNTLITQWRTISANYSQIIEAAARLFVADSVLRSFYLNADKLSNEVAIDVFEIGKAIYSLSKIFRKTSDLIENSKFDFLQDLVEDARDYTIDKLQQALSKSLNFSSSESYALKVFIISQLERLKTNAYEGAETFIQLIRPIVEQLAAEIQIKNEYIQAVTAKQPSSQFSLNYATSTAASLNYTGDFSTHFSDSRIKMVQAETAAELARIQAEYHRDLSEIAQEADDLVGLLSNAAAFTGLLPLAGLLKGLAFGGDLWAGTELAVSFSKARQGFLNNRASLQPVVSSNFRTSAPSSQQRVLGVPASLQKAVDRYNQTLNDLKLSVTANRYTEMSAGLKKVISDRRTLDTEIHSAFIPIMSAAPYALMQDKDFDSLLFSRFQTTFNRQPSWQTRFQWCYLALMLNSSDQQTRDSLSIYISKLIQQNSNIVPEFEGFYPLIQNITPYNYIQSIGSTIPQAMEKGTSKICVVKFKNVGPTDCSNLYAKVHFDDPFISDLDSIYIGNFASGKSDSLVIKITAPVLDTLVNYSVSFYSTNTMSDGFLGVVRARALPIAPGVRYADKVCFGDTLKLYANSPSAFARYHWSGPNGFNSDVQNPEIINVSEKNIGTYTCFVTSQGLSSNNSQISVSITKPSVAINGKLLFCKNQYTTLVATGGANYTWNTGATTPLINVQTAGTYSVIGKDANGCADTALVKTQILSLPLIRMASQLSMFQGETLPLNPTVTGNAPFTYKWTPNYAISNDTIISPLIQPHFNTTYNLKVTDRNGCFDTSSINVSMIGFFVYPNPVIDKASLYASGIAKGHYTFTLISQDGKTVYKESMEINVDSFMKQIDISRLQPGNYFVSIQGEATISSFKIIKL